jgi:hypothetical protein
MEKVFYIIENTIVITGFVMVMMLIIEYVNVMSRGAMSRTISSKPHLQILLAALLGLTPGCLGTFTVVSLFTHRIIGFGALTAALIATSGDEAFFMFSIMPRESMIVVPILLATALVAGYAVHLFAPRAYMEKFAGHLKIHEHEPVQTSILGDALSNLKNMSFHRALLLAGTLALLVSIATGLVAHTHVGGDTHQHCEHGASLGGFEITFIIVSIFSLYIFASASEHFLEEHLWKHVLKKHFLRILLWTLGALIVAGAAQSMLGFKLEGNTLWLVLGAAVLIGLIPESGPHLVFISLFVAGHIPLSILVANSIVQDGHGAIPLLAESPRHFIAAKAINAAAGIAVGGAMLYMGM